MSLFDTFKDYVRSENCARTVFEAAMKKRIETEGYKMSDLLYDLYDCQMRVKALEDWMQVHTSKSIKVERKAKK